MLHIWCNSLPLAIRIKQEARGVLSGGGEAPTQKESKQTRQKELHLVEMMFFIIWIQDNNMKIKTDNLRQKQFIFMACLLQKVLKLQRLGGGGKHKKMCFLYAAKPTAVILRLQVTRRVSALSFHRCFRRAVTCYLYATCCQALCGLPAYISQRKKKEPMLPACHHLAKTHHVNFMTTACYCCQFFHSESDSLGHPRKLTAFIFYGTAFVSF